MASYPREEMEEMMRRWHAAHDEAQSSGAWGRLLGPLYREDATYTWNVGPNEQFVAQGRQQIQDWALGDQMEGFDSWHFPYGRVLIDDTQGEVVGFWRQVAPVKRSDGSTYEVAGVGGSHFVYGGDFQWASQVDFFDLGNVVSLLMELATDGHLEPTLKRKIKRIAWGQPLTGHTKIRPGGDSGMRKLRGKLAMARIALFGR